MSTGRRPWKPLSRLGVGGSMLLVATFGFTVAGQSAANADPTCGNSTQAACPAPGSASSAPAGSTASTGDNGTGGSTLPVTGSNTTTGLLVAADLGLLGVPLLMVARRRRA